MLMIFRYPLTQCVRFFKENSLKSLNTKDFKNENLAIQANQVRLDFVENILCAAYVDDVSINNQFQSLVEYFIKTYTFEERLNYLRKAQPTLKRLELIVASKENFIQGMSHLSSKNFDVFLKDFAQFLNLQLATDITTVLQFNGFYIKAWESLDEKHTIKLNKDLPKEVKSEVTTRIRPEIEKTQKEITKLQKTIIDEALIHKEDEGLASVTQLGRTLTQWTYRIKSRVASYQKKTNQKVVFNNYEEAEKHLDLNPLSKRQLCSLLHSFYDPSHTLIPQTMVFSRFTWKQLHESVNLDWDLKIPDSTQEWTKLTLYCLFLESSLYIPR